MADAIQTQAGLIALTPDNTSGDYSNQDHRNMIVSVMGVYGEIWTSGGSTAQTGIGTSQVLLTGFATDGVVDGFTADNANNKLTVGTNGDGDHLIEFEAVFTAPSASEAFTFELRVGGALSGHDVTVDSNATPDEIHVRLSAIIAAVAADDIEVYVNASAASKSLTMESGRLRARRLG